MGGGRGGGGEGDKANGHFLCSHLIIPFPSLSPKQKYPGHFHLISDQKLEIHNSVTNAVKSNIMKKLARRKDGTATTRPQSRFIHLDQSSSVYKVKDVKKIQ